MFKTWTEALIDEVPLLIARSEIYKEMKPVIKYIELVQYQGGFIAGHYEIVFKVYLVKLFSSVAIKSILAATL